MDVVLKYGRRTIQVHVLFNERKRLSITVQPDCCVVAKVPVGTAVEKIEEHLRKRCRWIIAQLDYFEKYRPAVPPRQYVNGETHYFLGGQYRLRISKGNTNRVRLVGRFFEVEVLETKDTEKIGNLMKEWFARHAKELVLKRLSLFWPRFERMGAKEPLVVFRRMKKRWGSCRSRERIVLNTDLIKVPFPCIDYVIVHELCHLICLQHDQKFYRLLSRILPDWESRKERLEGSVL